MDILCFLFLDLLPNRIRSVLNSQTAAIYWSRCLVVVYVVLSSLEWECLFQFAPNFLLRMFANQSEVSLEAHRGKQTFLYTSHFHSKLTVYCL